MNLRILTAPLALTILSAGYGLGRGADTVGPPIALVKVTPEASVFRDSAWNKPIVIKSQNEAAKHFSEDALATLTKQVDFKKQFVLVFAWRGSGGDKLTYRIAESFPEQLFFSLQPGLTRDLRSHSQVFVLRSNVRWSVSGKGAGNNKENRFKVPQPTVRPLKFDAQDPTIVFLIGGMSKLTTLTDAGAVEKLVGKASAKSLTDAVDFQKESIVLVSWTTSGPPEGSLKHEVKNAGTAKQIVFYVQGPPRGNVRGQRARIGADFFAIPRDTKAIFDPMER